MQFTVKMPILFSAVACDRNIVANFASCDGNFMEIAETVLSKLPPSNNKMTYSHGIYLLHYIAEDEYIYFSITDKLCQRSRAFLFLNEIQRRFIASEQSKEDFITVLAAEMYRYSEDYSTITIRKGELDELNSIGVGCSESILGEKILYINNPDSISYSTTSNISAIPGSISVSIVSPTLEGVSVVNATLERISVLNPTSDGTVVSQTPERISAACPSSESISVSTLTPQEISVVSPTSEEIAVVSTISEGLSILSPTPQGISVLGSTPMGISVSNRTSERLSVVNPTTEGISVANLTLEEMSVVSPTSEGISTSSPTPNGISVASLTSERLSVVSPTTEGNSVVSPTSEEMSVVSPTSEGISIVSPTSERISEPVMSPILYVVIIGMVILIIGMAIYAFGPISCVVVTSVGIYSLLRSYAGSKDKSD